MCPKALELGQLAVEPKAELGERIDLAPDRGRTAIGVFPKMSPAESIVVHVELLSRVPVASCPTAHALHT
jgi:hypothetical protein